MRTSPHFNRPPAAPRAGFTLAEIMVALLLVTVTLVSVLVGLGLSQLDAAHTAAMKLARELALFKLGQIESGYYWEHMDDQIIGDFGEQGHEDFAFEVVFGDDVFESERDQFDSWRGDDYDYDDEDEEDEESEQPYEEVKVRVTFPPLGDFSNELILVRYVPWKQIYPGDGSSPVGDSEE